MTYRDKRDALLRRSALAAYLLCAALTIAAVISADGLDRQPLLAKPFHLDVAYLVTGNVYALAGLLVAWARPRHPIGWLLLASALLGQACTAGQTYGARALVMPGSELPLGAWALSLSAPLWIPSLIIPASSLLVRYPDGDRPVGPARCFDRMATAGMVAIVIGYAGSDNSVTDEVRNHLPPVRIPDLPAVVLLAGGALLMIGGALGILAHTVRRMLRATAPQRQQIVLLFTTSVVAVLLVWWGPSETVGVRAFALVPVAVAVGVLRYGLLGIGEWIRRTLLYGTLTAGVVGVFVAVTAVVAQVVPSGPAPEVLAASVVAVGLMPARERLQRAVDRLVYGDRTDLWSAVQRINAPVARGDVALLPGVLEAIARAVRSPGAAVSRADGLVMASHGVVPADATRIELRVADRDIGALLVAPRTGETGFAGADQRLLSTIAPMLAVVVHAVALAEDLERERQRVVDATQAERGRLRNDLHDGLGPSLTGVGLGLEALESRLVGAGDRDRELVTRLRAEVTGAVEDVRRIIDDLRPSALDGADLVSALHARAAALTRSGLEVDVVVPKVMPPLASDIEAAVYRVVDEALNNVVRHARATRCQVVLAAGHGLRVEVRDDGVGLPDQRSRRGLGLESMRARAEGLGGTFTAACRGGGTSVVLELPLVPA